MKVALKVWTVPVTPTEKQNYVDLVCASDRSCFKSSCDMSAIEACIPQSYGSLKFAGDPKYTDEAFRF